MIKVGITSCFFYPDMSRVVFGPKSLSYVENDMFRYVSQQGILPVLIPDLETDRLHDILHELDGIIFQGGNDLAPQSYGEEPIIDGKWLGDRHRDKYELSILDFAIRNDKPVLGICRGMQLMNVYFGGSLYQDIGTQKEGALTHRDAKKYDSVHHKIVFSCESDLSRMYKDIDNPTVNSVHHQGIKQIGSQLKVLAVSEKDDIVEAIEYTGANPGRAIGVQWHPEFSDSLRDTVIPADRLIRFFLNQLID